MNSPVINEAKLNNGNNLPVSSSHCQALVDRIAASVVFHRSARLREFLLYVGERSLGGRPDELTEAQIGIHVFGRAEGFNPGDDSIVRVTARQLRTRLAEYFDGEGRDEPVTLEIPKGSYVAVFAARTPAVVPPEPVPDTARPARGSDRKLLWLLCLATLVSTCAAIWFWAGSRANAPRPAATLARMVLTSGAERTLVVLTDSGLLIAEKLLPGTIPNVERYASGEYLQHLDQEFARNRVPGDLARHLRVTQHTGIADAAVYGRILRSNPDLMDRVLLRHARGVSSRDFQTENAILIGSSGANPWAKAYAGDMNFLLNHDPPTQANHVVNVKPLAGEPAQFDSPPGSNVGFGHVLLVRNGSGAGHMLLISGTDMEAKEAAGEFITDPAAFQHLLTLVKRDSLSQVRRLEVLLYSKKLAGSAHEWHMLAHRISD